MKRNTWLFYVLYLGHTEKDHLMILIILAILFTIGAGMVCFSNRDDIRRTGFILEFVSALIFTLTLLVPSLS